MVTCKKIMSILRRKDKYYKTRYVCPQHTDTGILTFIPVSEIAGLQMFDKSSNKYIDIENIGYQPRKRIFSFVVVDCEDVILFPGEKFSVFAASTTFDATPHRVKACKNSRISMAFMLDVTH